MLTLTFTTARGADQACPPHIARDCPKELQALLGYAEGYQPDGPLSLYGTFAEVLSADVALRGEYDVMAPGAIPGDADTFKMRVAARGTRERLPKSSKPKL